MKPSPQFQLFCISTVFYFSIFPVFAQSNTLDAQFLAKKEIEKQLLVPSLVKQFYQANHYQRIWTQKTLAFKGSINNHIFESNKYGLDMNQYFFSETDDSLKNEILQTDRFFAFFHDLAFGNTANNFVFNSLKYKNNCVDLPMIFNTFFQKNEPDSLIFFLQPSSATYKKLLEFSTKINNRRNENLVQEDFIEMSDSLKKNNFLYKKLYLLGLLDNLADSSSVSEKTMTDAVKDFEQLFNLKSQGRLSKNTLEKLNIPISIILEKVSQNLNQWRVMRCMEHEKYIHVNVPSASFALYKNDSIITKMRVIVGKIDTPTPIFCAKIYQVTFFPYWIVPKNIVIKETLPNIKKDKRYLRKNNFQVLDSDGNIVNDSTIVWADINEENLPYRFRQLAGTSNSLGVVKFEVDDPFSIYLHDTDNRKLFSQEYRFLSHGCVRLEKPFELAGVLLENKPLVSKILAKKNDKNLVPIPYKLKESIPVFITYFTIALNELGKLTFFDDVYVSD